MSPLVKNLRCAGGDVLNQPPTVKPLYIAPRRILGPFTIELVIAARRRSVGLLHWCTAWRLARVSCTCNHEGRPTGIRCALLLRTVLKATTAFDVTFETGLGRIPRILNGGAGTVPTPVGGGRG